ncbi:MAG: NADP-dependent phosphogluconate dehydrogenase, partial [Vicinamibacteraceae bacterium]
MQIGMIGLGRMGGNMVRRLMSAGHTASVYDRSVEAVDALVSEGAAGASSLETLVSNLETPRVFWIMVPAGAPTEQTVETLAPLLARGDIIVDGGNSYFKDDVRRAEALKPRGIHYVDVGTSGGVWGLERGYCLMIGGPAEAVTHLDPIFRALAPGESGVARTPGRAGKAVAAELGYLHCGPVGAGHFVKMVHNGLEDGLMQAYAEGFDILRSARLEQVPEAHRYEL